jgi:hypothetical protein
VRELAALGAADPYGRHVVEVEMTRRALRGLAAAGLVELALVRLDGSAQKQPRRPAGVAGLTWFGARAWPGAAAPRCALVRPRAGSEGSISAADPPR